MIWLTTLIDFLNTNSGGMVAIFTGVYVVGTLLMWWEMRQTRLDIDEPRLQISLIPRRVRHSSVIDLLIENVGNVPIINLKLSFTPSDLKNTHSRKLAEIFKEPIKTLGRDRNIKIIMFRNRDWGEAQEIKIIAEYASLYNKKLRKSLDFIFDMENLKLIDNAPYEYSNEDFINELRNIEMAIGSLRFPIEEIKSIKAREEFEKNRIN